MSNDIEIEGINRGRFGYAAILEYNRNEKDPHKRIYMLKDFSSDITEDYILHVIEAKLNDVLGGNTIEVTFEKDSAIYKYLSGVEVLPEKIMVAALDRMSFLINNLGKLIRKTEE